MHKWQNKRNCDRCCIGIFRPCIFWPTANRENAEKASREMDKLGKKRAKPKLGLEDKASPVLDKFRVKRETRAR